MLLYGLLHVADGLVTYLGLSSLRAEEANPILNFFAGLIGLGLSITLFKAAELVLIARLFVKRRSLRSRWVTATLLSAVGSYTWVVTNNLVLVFDL
jgi:hypothetical protein